MKKAIFGIAFVLLVLTYAISLTLRDPSTLPNALEIPNHPGFYDYRGVLNIQTSHSGGYLNPQEVIRLAQETKLDFVVFQDLNRFIPGGPSEGWQRQLLVFNGAKYSYLESRILVLQPERLKSVESLGQAQTIIADLLSSAQTSRPKSEALILGQASRDGTEWAGLVPEGIVGLEVLNIHQHINRLWRDERMTLIWSLLIYPFNSELALIRLFADLDLDFNSWDRMSRSRRTFGIIGSDAGQPAKILGWPLNIPSYESLFNLASNHVLLRSELTGEFESDREKVLSAIQNGQSYIAFDSLGQTKGFATWYEDAKGIKQLGSRPLIDDRSRLLVRLPRKPTVPFETVILKDGAGVMTSNSTETDYRIYQPGVYRVAVRLFVRPSIFDGGRWIPWILTNPITVQAAHQGSRSSASASH
jgi:hypothetical protein